LVIFGRGGHTTFEALAWLDRIGASFLHLDRSGRVVAMSGQPGPDFPALRRAQVAALDTDVGLSIVKRLMGAKLRGQRTVVGRYGSERAERRLTDASDALDWCNDSRQVLAIEAKAASVYWAALADLPVRFADADAGLIPERWSTVGERHSILSSKPRLAITPGHSVVNFLYHLATAEASLALLALGLDPGLGWAHRDAPYRDSAALDLVEAVRPEIDEYVFHLLAQRTFSRREFIELPTGQVRIAPPLAKLLAEATCGRWESAVVGHATEVARTLARSAGPNVRAPKAVTRGAGGKGRGALSRGSSRSSSRVKTMPSACRSCGVVLDTSDRAYCPDCVPAFEAERTATLVRAAKENLSAMRASPHDPAQSEEARRKRIEKARQMSLAARAWEREHGSVADPTIYECEILPKLQALSVRQLVALTGLSDYYLWQVRKGEKRLHARFWERIASA
jgi:CRISPR-associated protein Cas1